MGGDAICSRLAGFTDQTIWGAVRRFHARQTIRRDFTDSPPRSHRRTTTFPWTGMPAAARLSQMLNRLRPVVPPFVAERRARLPSGISGKPELLPS
jgi:hypothetical protein